MVLEKLMQERNLIALIPEVMQDRVLLANLLLKSSDPKGDER